MKKILLILSLVVCVNAFATVRTVNNNPNSLAQYNTIQAAVDAAVNGDTIYIHGSNTSYGSFTVSNKRLIFIGPGWSPLRNIDPLTASISQMTFQSAGCDNSEIQGLVFTAIVTLGFNHPNNIRFYRNQFINTQLTLSYGTTDYSGFVFQGNWFDKSQIIGNQNNTYTNCIFQNNIFYYNTATANIYGFTNSNGVLFDHNLFYGPSSGAGAVFAGDCRSLLITNNIFVRRNAATQCTSSTFNNNITYNAVVDTPWIAAHGNIGANNVAGQNPQMGDQAAVNTGTDDPLLNFTIAAGPANNSGTDGKDMGLLYDPTGMLNWSNSRMSRIPFIYNMVISNSTVVPGGSLSVQVEARKNN
jgi:hypothetical protein